MAYSDLVFHISVIFPWARKRKAPQGVVFEDISDDESVEIRKEEEEIMKAEMLLAERKKKLQQKKEAMKNELMNKLQN